MRSVKQLRRHLVRCFCVHGRAESEGAITARAGSGGGAQEVCYSFG